MTADLWCLVVSALTGLVLTFVEVSAKTKIAGVEWNAGNRDEQPKVPPWVERTGRAIANHKENFPLFLTAVLVTHLAGKADRTTAIASAVYVVARIVYSLLYIGGVKRVRSLAFVVGLGATLVIFSRVFFT